MKLIRPTIYAYIHSYGYGCINTSISMEVMDLPLVVLLLASSTDEATPAEEDDIKEDFPLEIEERGRAGRAGGFSGRPVFVYMEKVERGGED